MQRTGERKSLSLRLFAAFFSVTLLAFLSATAIVVYISWTVYEGNAEERLTAQVEATAQKIARSDIAEQIRLLGNEQLAETRITLVSSDGTVLFDSQTNAAAMENHAKREEIVLAQGGADSVALRKSETTGTDSLYAACLVDGAGTVLRLSETRTSLAYYLGNLFAPLFLAIVLAVVVSVLLARAITKLVTAPLVSVNLETPLESNTYREIDPLLRRIDAQRNKLVSQNAQLEKSMEMRREFTGNVSHEMKSPLQVIGGYAELIEQGLTSENDTRKFAGLIRSESQSMRALIDDVLMLSKLDEDAGNTLHAVDPLPVCKTVVERLAQFAADKGVSVSLACEAPVTIYATEALLEQAMYNLLDNAIQYGGNTAALSIACEGQSVAIAVSDNGPGIPETLRARVFERFYRIDTSRSRETGGTGLGLAIVKHATETMGGTVEVCESALGGASFIIRLVKA